MENELSKLKLEIEKEYSQKWKHHIHTDDELKTIARDIIDEKIFTDRHLGQDAGYMVQMVFMPVMLMGPTANTTGVEDEVAKKRIELEYEVSRRDVETKYYEQYLKEIGMIYEYMDKAMPRGINGYPIFGSCGFLSIDDYERMIVFYKKYKELKEEMEKKRNEI